jgi:hypothetical protein
VAVWSAINTESVQLSTPTASFKGEADGQQGFCATPGRSVSLVASGPGGQDKASARL